LGLTPHTPSHISITCCSPKYPKLLRRCLTPCAEANELRMRTSVLDATVFVSRHGIQPHAGTLRRLRTLPAVPPAKAAEWLRTAMASTDSPDFSLWRLPSAFKGLTLPIVGSISERKPTAALSSGVALCQGPSVCSLLPGQGSHGVLSGLQSRQATYCTTVLQNNQYLLDV